MGMIKMRISEHDPRIVLFEEKRDRATTDEEYEKYDKMIKDLVDKERK